MNYAEALAYLDGYINYEKVPPRPDGTRGPYGLERPRELAAHLGDPQEEFWAVHVAGTKGKGSTCAFAAAMLRAAGLRVGLYTSPHLVDLRERIQVDGVEIEAAAFAEILSRCQPVLEKLRVRPAGERRLTYFEVLTHLAFWYFAERQVDVAVVEVGMGGRLDATNLVTPAVCGVTSLSLDHMQTLGATLPEIAREKAGIFKPGVPVVSAPQPPDAARVLEETAAQVGVKVEFVGRELHLQVTQPRPAAGRGPIPGARAEVHCPADGWAARAELGLLGSFQAENWAVAVRLAHLACRKIRSAALPEAAIQRGSREVSWPGRLEEVPSPNGAPRLFLDGAHNEYSVQVVLTEVRRLLPGAGPLVVLFGCAKDKDAPAMLGHLARLADAVVFTSAASPRSRPPEELAALWRERTGREAPVEPAPPAALALAQRQAGGGVVLATGSLYLVGALMSALAGKRS